MTDIHNRKETFDNHTSTIRTNYNDHNADLILSCVNDMSSQDISIYRQARILSSFNTLANKIDFKLDEASKKQLKDLVADINRGKVTRQDGSDKEYSPWTLAEFKKAIRRFYKWHTGKKDPEIIDFISVNVKKKDRKQLDPDKLLEPSEVNNLVRSASSVRDRAMIFLLWETGTRIQELLSITWGDVRFKEDMTKIDITNSKSMQRTVYVKEAVPELEKWRETHPAPEDPDAPVFVTLRASNQGQNQLKYGGAYDAIKKAVDNSDVGDEMLTNPHGFRKARATYLASQGWNAAQLCQQFGWNDFATARSYIQLAKQDLKDAVKDLHGLDVDQDESVDDDSLDTVRCQKCDTVNAGTDTHCRDCNTVLSSADELFVESQKDELAKDAAQEIITALIEDQVDTEEQAEEKTKDLVTQAVDKKLEEQGLI